MEFITIEEALKRFDLQRWFLDNLIKDKRVFSSITETGIVYVSVQSLQEYFDRRINAKKEDSENVTRESDKPDIVYRPDYYFSDVDEESAKARKVLAEAKLAELELEQERTPYISIGNAGDYASIKQEADTEYAKLRAEIKAIKTIIYNEEIDYSARQRILETKVLERLLLVVADLQKIQLDLRFAVSIGKSHLAIFKLRMENLKAQSQILSNLNDKIMPDLRSVDHDFSSKGMETEPDIASAATIYVVDAQGNKKPLVLNNAEST